MASVAHGWSLIRHINADNVLTVHPYCHMLGTQSITREPKLKSVSKHFVLHCIIIIIIITIIIIIIIIITIIIAITGIIIVAIIIYYS